MMNFNAREALAGRQRIRSFRERGQHSQRFVGAGGPQWGWGNRPKDLKAAHGLAEWAAGRGSLRNAYEQTNHNGRLL